MNCENPFSLHTRWLQSVVWSAQPYILQSLIFLLTSFNFPDLRKVEWASIFQAILVIRVKITSRSLFFYLQKFLRDVTEWAIIFTRDLKILNSKCQCLYLIIHDDNSKSQLKNNLVKTNHKLWAGSSSL